MTMRKNNAIALIGEIREKANKLIVKGLEERGIEGIVPSHGEIIVLLLNAETLTMQELAQKIHRTKPTITVLVEKLVDHGYVSKEKSPKDNRVSYVRITEKGLALKPGFWEISDRLNNLVYKGFSESEAEQFEALLERVMQNITGESEL